MTASAEFLQASVEQVGAERTEQFVGAVLESMAFAEMYHELEWPLESVAIGFSRWPEVVEGVPWSRISGLNHGYYGLRIMFNLDNLHDDIVDDIRPVVVHEVSHCAAQQNAYLNGEVDGPDNPWSLLRYVFDEGTAKWHESLFLNQKQSAHFAANFRANPTGIDMLQEVDMLVARAHSTNVADLYQYLFGDEEHPKKGYRVGVALVDFALGYGLTHPKELVQLGSADVREIGKLFLEDYDETAA